MFKAVEQPFKDALSYRVGVYLPAMSMRNKVVTAGALGLILALGLIAGSTYFLPSANHTSSQTSTSIQTSPPSGTSQSHTSGAFQGGTGTLDVLLTDPPTVPSGVTAIYVTYSNVAVHVSGAGNESGWTNSNTTGTLSLMKLVNVSSTIATIKVSEGTYNALRFNISSAAVTYNGKNYTAFVQGAVLNVAVPGGIPVNATTSSAAIIDMHPTVVNIGSNSTPEFIISTAGFGYCIPHQNVTGDMGEEGHQIDLGTSAWWHQLKESYTANITISSATLKAGSFSITIANKGSTPINISAIFVAPLGNECPMASANSTGDSNSQNAPVPQSHSKVGHHGGPNVLPMCLTGSANFLVLNNGTIVPISSAISMPPHMTHSAVGWGLFGQTGYQIGAGKSVTLSYTGSITFGWMMHPGLTPPGVIAGDQYDITVVGQQALAATIVVAS